VQRPGVLESADQRRDEVRRRGRRLVLDVLDRAPDLVERIEDHEAHAGLGRRGELLVALVVAVQDDALGGHPGLQSEGQLAECRDVRAEPLGGEEAQQRDVRERLDAVGDQRACRRGQVRGGAGTERLLAVDEERRAVFLSECRGRYAANGQLAALERGALGEELKHRFGVSPKGDGPGKPGPSSRKSRWPL
jgi:hypothetical protein